ncbi:DUF4031 domain-containing protein [Actinacidiphila yeochonensis]|uniref:DUF4031 domain-containing protein n=1 Tax=Actinacidiphila yeochonensis TaxID=89050 RepID=UPI000560112B|nr:DUF4031 domain-containing protein [Actinacidiphila yeochonensis]
MTVYIDPPTWPGHGRLWSHMVSDASYEELHAFADRLGVPPRAFERDHYDIAQTRYAAAVALGAVPVGSKELVRRLTGAGLRRRKYQGGGAPAGSASA